MAAVLRSVATELEMAFFSVIVEAAVKMADIADSKLLIIHETSEGSRRLAGHDCLIESFKSGNLASQPSDATYDKPERSFGVFLTSDDLKNEDRVRDTLKKVKRVRLQSESPVYQKRKKLDKTVKSDDEDDEDAYDMKLPLDNDDDNFEMEGDGGGGFGVLEEEFEDSPTPDNTDGVTCGESHWGDDDHHQKSAKKGQIQVINPPKRDLIQVVKKRCKFCPSNNGMTYTVGSYRYHVRAEHQRNQVCPYCDKGFIDKFHLKRHLNRRACLKRGTGSIPEDKEVNINGVSDIPNLAVLESTGDVILPE